MVGDFGEAERVIRNEFDHVLRTLPYKDARLTLDIAEEAQDPKGRPNSAPAFDGA